MITKDQVKSELDALDEQDIEFVYKIIKSLRRQKAPATSAPPTLMDKLKTLHISGPVDFADNIDTYLSGTG